MHLLHTLFPKLCRRQLRWRGNTLCCGHCGNLFGFRYKLGDGLRIYLFPQYEDMRDAVLALPDTKQVASITDVLGEVSFVEFDDAIEEIRERSQELNDAAQPDEKDLADDDAPFIVCDPENDYFFDYMASFADPDDLPDEFIYIPSADT